LHDKTKSDTTRTLWCKCGGCMGRRLLALTRGDLDGMRWKGAVEPSEQLLSRGKTEHPEVSRGHSTMRGTS
jgi:hypothetical protein